MVKFRALLNYQLNSYLIVVLKRTYREIGRVVVERPATTFVEKESVFAFLPAVRHSVRWILTTVEIGQTKESHLRTQLAFKKPFKMILQTK